MNKDYVLVRDSRGSVRVYSAYCPHRGCDLSLGTHDGDALICPFHGWEFNSQGSCVHIPANQSQAHLPIASRIATFSTYESQRLIWVFTKDKEYSHTPLYTFPELEEGSKWRRVLFQKTWNAHFTRTVESVLDVSHLPFVHPETAGTDVDARVEGPNYDVTETGLVIYPTPFASSHPMEPPMPRLDSGYRTVIELLFPNQWIIRTPMGDAKWMCTFLTFTPINDETTNIFGFVLRNFDHNVPFLDTFHLEHTDFVMGQDQVIVESLRPRTAPEDMHHEAHVPSDVPSLRFRAMLLDALQEEKQS